jgi:hypothetical protein
MVLFSNKQEANLRVCVKMVDDAISALGHVPDESRIVGAEADMPAWRVKKGSAHVFVSLGIQGHENVLRVLAPVLHVAPGTDKLKLFRHLLELNATAVTGAAFGLQGEDVVLCAERTTVDLDPSEVMDMIRRVENFADQYDDLLVAEFGGRAAGPSSMPV